MGMLRLFLLAIEAYSKKTMQSFGCIVLSLE